LELEASSLERDPRILQALSRVGACGWARRELPGWHRQCEGDYAPKTCPLLAAAEAEVDRACPAEAAGSDASIDSGLAARLAAPRRIASEDRHVPAERRWVGKRPDDPPSQADYPMLADRRIVALSPSAERMFAVSVSEDLDPRGEVSAGGYWL